jgi:hypothetical protein
LVRISEHGISEHWDFGARIPEYWNLATDFQEWNFQQCGIFRSAGSSERGIFCVTGLRIEDSWGTDFGGEIPATQDAISAACLV